MTVALYALCVQVLLQMLHVMILVAVFFLSSVPFTLHQQHSKNSNHCPHYVPKKKKKKKQTEWGIMCTQHKLFLQGVSQALQSTWLICINTLMLVTEYT